MPSYSVLVMFVLFFLARGRPKKTTEESSDSQASETSVTENEEAKTNDESKNANAETNSHEEKEETANNNAEAAKVSTIMYFNKKNLQSCNLHVMITVKNVFSI